MDNVLKSRIREQKEIFDKFQNKLEREAYNAIGKGSNNKAVVFFAGGHLEFLSVYLREITRFMLIKFAENANGINPYEINDYVDYCEIVYKLALESSVMVRPRYMATIALQHITEDLGFRVLSKDKSEELMINVLTSVLNQKPSKVELQDAYRILRGNLKGVSTKDDSYINNLCTACMVYEKYLDVNREADISVVRRDLAKKLSKDKALAKKYFRDILLASKNLDREKPKELKAIEEVITTDEQQALEQDFRLYLEGLPDKEDVECNLNKERILVVHPIGGGLHKIDGREFLFVESFTFKRLVENNCIDFNKFCQVKDGVVIPRMNLI